MAVNFPTNLSTGAGSIHTLLDLRENKVQGIGFFDTLVEAQSLNANQRCLGYLAVVSNGVDAGTLYQFTGTSVDSWASNDSWSALGTTEPTTTTAARVLHHNLSTTVNLAQTTATVDGGEVQILQPGTIVAGSVPKELELRFDGAETFGYKVDGGANPFFVQPEFTKDLMATATNTFTQVDGETPITSCVITGTVTVGDAVITIGNADTNAGKFDGLNAADSAALLAGTWDGTNNPVLAALLQNIFTSATYNTDATGGSFATRLAYTPLVPIQAENSTYVYVHFNASAYASAAIAPSALQDGSNYTVVHNGTGDPHIGLYAWLYEGGVQNDEVLIGLQSPSLQALPSVRGANVGPTGDLSTEDRINTLEDLEKLRIKLKLSDAAVNAIIDEVNSSNHSATWKDCKLKVDIGITITQ
jgi:hypothetical protein